MHTYTQTHVCLACMCVWHVCVFGMYDNHARDTHTCETNLLDTYTHIHTYTQTHVCLACMRVWHVCVFGMYDNHVRDTHTCETNSLDTHTCETNLLDTYTHIHIYTQTYVCLAYVPNICFMFTSGIAFFRTLMRYIFTLYTWTCYVRVSTCVSTYAYIQTCEFSELS